VGDPRRTAEKPLPAVIQEAYVQDVSTRSVDELVKAMGMSGISKSQVSRLCAEIDERVNAFLCRPLAGDWPYLWIDATYVKGRESGRIVSKAAVIAVAMNAEGVCELLGMAIGPSEAEPFWTDFLRSLTRRGLRGVKLVISDAHEGLKAAAAKVLAATWQRCKVHFLRNAQADSPILVSSSRNAGEAVYESPDSVTVSDSCRRKTNLESSSARFFPESPSCINQRFRA